MSRSGEDRTGTKPRIRLDPMTADARTPSAIDDVAERWVDTLVDLSPVLATYIGRNEANGRLDDVSPEGHARSVDAARAALAELDALDPVDRVDEVTKTDLSAELRLQIELHDAQWHLRDLNVIASPPQDFRQAFDLMPTAQVEDWAVVAERLAAVPDALRGYVDTLRQGIRESVVPARRQVSEVATQIARYSADDGFFAKFTDRKSTRLNSSHVKISYAVFCLK